MAPEKRERGHRWRKLTARMEAQYATRNGGIILCHLCDGVTDRKAAKGEPDALTWDHIQARSQRPDLELHPDNLAPACALCNSMRRDRPLPDIVGTPEQKVLWKRQRALNVQRQLLRKDKATGGTAPAARGIYQRGVDYSMYCPISGKLRSETLTFRPFVSERFMPSDDRPYDENTGQRRPGVEWPIGSGNYGL